MLGGLARSGPLAALAWLLAGGGLTVVAEGAAAAGDDVAYAFGGGDANEVAP